ncbi:hypothetical protein G1K46_02545 [Tenacibaculum finnmarkense]|uniref:hypothetical protein n=1 Tax=Tenacibaculum finnmarkense TaxID=2781243 RepID=UPI001EFBD743|nr:hypothetical protein [Tenacibaculum finnmarkense]MCG8761612.1 hypothetical protein [Tenacibaculum finnmarkense]MCG8786986.1 hypothetical protein [Tenacibaculum finnmarkense]
MLPTYNNSIDLLVNVTKNNLYSKLIIQLTKDFSLANSTFEIPENTTPDVLTKTLNNTLKNLILTDSKTFQSLLYIVDVPENMLYKIDTSNIDNYTETVVFLILKRVWKKVWFSANYSR